MSEPIDFSGSKFTPEKIAALDNFARELHGLLNAEEDQKPSDFALDFIRKWTGDSFHESFWRGDPNDLDSISQDYPPYAPWTAFFPQFPQQTESLIDEKARIVLCDILRNLPKFARSNTAQKRGKMLKLCAEYLQLRGILMTDVKTDGPPIDLLMELTPNSRTILRYLWSNRETTNEALYRYLYGDEPRQVDALRKAVERLNEQLSEHAKGKIQVRREPPDVFLKFI